MNLSILGASGSIGSTTINGLKYLNNVNLTSLSFHTNEEKARDLDQKFNLKAICFTGISKTKYKYKAKVYFNNIKQMLIDYPCDKVVNAIIGFDGVKATEIITSLGISLALANKESIVCCGSFLFKESKSPIIPIDSEHSAIYNLLKHRNISSINKVLITCSGGPLLREFNENIIYNAPLNKILNHPTWSMGKQITVDSATYANKGLEVIEASYLFNLTKEQIQVTIHPQSIVHSLIELKSGMQYCQLSKPDMSYAILSSLGYVDDKENIISPLDFNNLKLEFEKPDIRRFPLLKLAFDCIGKNPTYAIAYQTSNEIAVQNYINGKIKFGDIYEFVKKTLEAISPITIKNYSDVYLAHNKAKEIINKLI